MAGRLRKRCRDSRYELVTSRNRSTESEARPAIFGRPGFFRCKIFSCNVYRFRIRNVSEDQKIRPKINQMYRNDFRQPFLKVFVSQYFLLLFTGCVYFKYMNFILNVFAFFLSFCCFWLDLRGSYFLNFDYEIKHAR